MAAFLNRLGALAPGKVPKVNADKVDGITSADLMPGGNPPAGMTVRGNWALNGAADEWRRTSISFGYELSAAPDANYIQAGAASTAACPGSATNPEAAFGELCVYEDASSMNGNPTLDCIFSASSGFCDLADETGFGISQLSGAEWFAGGTWAVTEPFIIILAPEVTDGPTKVGDSAD